MLRTASSLPPQGLLTLGSGPARFQTTPPACYRASWQLPGPDSHRQATTSLRTTRSTTTLRHVSPPVLLGARKRLSALINERSPPPQSANPHQAGQLSALSVARDGLRAPDAAARPA